MRPLALLLALWLVAPGALAAPQDELPAPVRSALAAARVPKSSVAVVVERVDAVRSLVAFRAGAPMNPASTMKLVTSYAALDLLGPAFTFRTAAYLDGTLADGVLRGDLVLRGGGDPGLTYERLWQLAHALRARGLREIRGDVVVDRSYFAAAPHDPARFDHQPRRAYNAGPDALLVNFHAVDFRFVPGPGGQVRILAEPDLPDVRIDNRVDLATDACGDWRHRLRYRVEEKGLAATVAFSGRYAVECGERTWPLVVFDGPGYFESAFRWVWSEAGGRLAGRVREGRVPDRARAFLTWESAPLADLVRDMNKFSNNVMARNLFLALSAERAGAGTEAASAAIVRDWLAAKDIGTDGLAIDNGSGLSRGARVTAATLAGVLASAWSSPLMPELAASLPLYAVDGTLKDRAEGPAAGQAHLKGGTLTGVQALAGYVLDRRARRWIVVMLVNDPNANAAGPAFDALVGWVHARGAR